MSIHQLNTALGWAAVMNEDKHVYDCASLHNISKLSRLELLNKEKKVAVNRSTSGIHTDEHVIEEERTVFGKERSGHEREVEHAKREGDVHRCNSENANNAHMHYGSHPYLEQSLPELSSTSLSLSLLSSSQQPPLTASSTFLPSSSFYSSSFSSPASSSFARDRCYTKSPTSSSFRVYPSNVSNGEFEANKSFATCSCSSFVRQFNNTESDISNIINHNNNSASLENYLRSFTDATKEFLSTTCTTLSHSVEPSSTTSRVGLRAAAAEAEAEAAIPASSSIIYSCHAELNHRRRRSSHRINVRPSSAPLHSSSSSSSTASHTPQLAKHNQLFSSHSKLKVKPVNLFFTLSQPSSSSQALLSSTTTTKSESIPAYTNCKEATLSTSTGSINTNGVFTKQIQPHTTSYFVDENVVQNKLSNDVSNQYVNSDVSTSSIDNPCDDNDENNSRLSRHGENHWCNEVNDTTTKSDDSKKLQSFSHELTSNAKNMTKKSEQKVALSRPPLAPSAHNIYIHQGQQSSIHRDNIVVNNYASTERNVAEAKHYLNSNNSNYNDNDNTTDEPDSINKKYNNDSDKIASNNDSNSEKHDVNVNSAAHRTTIESIKLECTSSDDSNNHHCSSAVDREESTFSIKLKQSVVINQNESTNVNMIANKSTISNNTVFKQNLAERNECERKMNERRVLIAQHVSNGDDYAAKHNYAAAEINYTRAICTSCLNSFLVMKRACAFLHQQHLQAAELDLRWVLYALLVEEQICKTNANVHNTCAVRATFVQAYWLMAQLTLSSMQLSNCDVNRCKQKAIYYYDKALSYCKAIDVTLRSTYNQFNYYNGAVATPNSNNGKNNNNNNNSNIADINNLDKHKESYSDIYGAAVTNEYCQNKREMLQNTQTHPDNAQSHHLHKQFTRKVNMNNMYDNFFTNFTVAYEDINCYNANKMVNGDRDIDEIEHNERKGKNDIYGSVERGSCYEGHIVVKEEEWEEQEQNNIVLWNEKVDAIRAIITNEKETLTDFVDKYLHHLEKQEWLDATMYTEKIIALIKTKNEHCTVQEACPKVNERKNSKEENESTSPFWCDNSWLITLWSERQVETILEYIPSTALQCVEELEKNNVPLLEHFLLRFLKAKALFYTSHDKETTEECLRLLAQCEKANDVEELKHASNAKQYVSWSSHVAVPPHEIYDAECNELNSLLQTYNASGTTNSSNSNNNIRRKDNKFCSAGGKLTLFISSHMYWRIRCMRELKCVIEEFVFHRDLGNSCYLHGKYNASVRHYNVCLTLDSHNKSLLATTQCNLAAVEINRKQYWKALEHVNNAITMYKSYNNLESGYNSYWHVHGASNKYNTSSRAGNEENDMKSCTASCKDATHNAETTNTKEDKNSIDCGGNECNYRNINLSNHENLSKAFARRGRIYLQLFLRNVSLPTTNKAETDDKIRDIFMRKPEMHDNDNHNDDDDDDDDEEYKREECIYEGKKCKMTDANSQYQLDCITFSIKDFRHAIYLARGTSCDVEMLCEQLNKARAQRQHFMQRWSHVRQNEANWGNETSSYSSNNNNTSNFTSSSYNSNNNGFASKNGKKGSSFPSFTASSSKPSSFRPSTASPYSTSYASYNYGRATPLSSEAYNNNYFSSSSYSSSSSSSMPYSSKNNFFTSHVNGNERAKLLKFLHLVEIPDSLLGKTCSSSSSNANDKSSLLSSSSSPYFNTAEMNVNGNNSSNNVDALINSSNSRQFINRVYKKAALQWHPDRWSNAPENQRHAAEQRFKEINTLYHELLDVHK